MKALIQICQKLALAGCQETDHYFWEILSKPAFQYASARRLWYKFLKSQLSQGVLSQITIFEKFYRSLRSSTRAHEGLDTNFSKSALAGWQKSDQHFWGILSKPVFQLIQISRKSALAGCLKSDYYWIWLDQMNIELSMKIQELSKRIK